MKKLAGFIFLFVAIGGFLTLNFSSCVNNDPTIAHIRVLDSIGNPVEGADVKVFCTEALCVVEDSGITDALGKTSHEFELPAVLKVETWRVYSWKYDTIFLVDTVPPMTVDTFVDTTIFRTFFGETYVTLEEHEEVSQDIVIFGNVPQY